jgi:hypothetical protein
MRRLFAAYAIFVVGSYAVASWRGWELGAPKRGVIPQSVRQSPGGYRSYNFWRGGK